MKNIENIKVHFSRRNILIKSTTSLWKKNSKKLKFLNDKNILLIYAIGEFLSIIK